jgi:hypothetical protein
MRKIYLLLLVFLASTSVWAQKNGSVKGLAFDTLSKQVVANATVTLLEKKDSSLVSFTMTDNSGRFELKGIPNGEYRLLITHVNYHNSNTLFKITDGDKIAELGNIVMNDVAKTLPEVVVRNEDPPVTMINDTIQYNAGSFKTPPNASVEQLLKKLPGVKVEKDGTIKAQGEKVNRVLVDGKEFFGNDPKIATKNLPADAIDKVQVYDKQSDQAQLTGFEDGNYEKTINLKLKKDKKKGLFGKVTAGAGTNDRYEGKFNMNSFKGARQMSAIAMANNTNADGFSFMDILNFTGALKAMQSGGGNVNINMTGDDAAAMGVNPGGHEGITTARGGGLNYNNIIGTKLDFQSNYFYNSYNPYTESHVERQYFLPDSTYFSKQNSYADNQNNTHRINLNMLYQLDSFNSIRFTPSFSYQNTKNKSRNDYQTLSEEKNLTNEGFSNNLSSNSGYNFKSDLIWRKKFRRKGRTFSLSLNTSLNETDGDGSLSSITSFYYPNGSLLKKDTLNQKNEITGDLRGYNARAVYTEPLGKRSLLELSAGRSNTKSTAEKTTWDYNKTNGKYDMVNHFLTNDFENTYDYTNAGIRVRTQKKKYNYAVGVSWQQSGLEGKIISGTKDSVISKTFHNLLPNARFQYNFSKFRTLSLTYVAAVNQPSISQLQPVPDVSNPLYIKNGNPDLKQEYSHNLMGQLAFLSPYKNKNFFTFFNLQATKNKIVNYDTLTQLGVKQTKPVNVNGVYNFNSNISYSLPVRFLKGSIEFSSRNGYFHGKQFINGVGNTSRTLSVGPSVRLDMNPNDKLTISIGADLSYTKTKYSLQPSLNNNYLLQEYNTAVDWEMPKGFFLSSDFTYSINSQRAAGFNAKIPIWNASVSKQMLNYNRGELKFTATDLLNRNIGINRSTNQNYIEDSRVMTLRQFFLVSFTYNLSKTGLTKAAGGNMQIRMR